MLGDIYFQNSLSDGAVNPLLVRELWGITRGCVVSHVGESVHHAAAQGAAAGIQIADIRPLASFQIKALNLIDGVGAVESPDHKEAVVDHCDAEVTAGIQHGGCWVPAVCLGTVDLNRAQTVDSTETTNLSEKWRMVCFCSFSVFL